MSAFNQYARLGLAVLQASPRTIRAVKPIQLTSVRSLFGVKSRTPSEQLRPHMFSPTTIKKHYSVIPLLVFIGGAVVTVFVFSSYFWYTRPELTIYKGSPTMGDKMDLVNPPHLKIYKAAELDRSNAELAKLYADIAEAEEKQKK